MSVADIVIVGSGFAGLGMGIRLKKAGITDFVVLERAADLGGTWRDNVYPGCACDIPSLLYSFSFEPNDEWSRAYPSQPEIWAYLRRCAKKYGLEPHIRYNAEVVEARYDEAAARWHVTTSEGATYSSRVLVSGMGGLSNPYVAELPGGASFPGPQFHSATWDHSVNLAGKDVAVIGTGASAIQFVPQIAPIVGKLRLYQRTPPWISPRFDGPVSARERLLRRRLPGYAWAQRKLLYWSHEARALGFVVNPGLLRLLEKLATKFLEHQVRDPALREKLRPNYRLGCKRVLLSNDYYPSLSRPNVEVVTDPISRVEGGDIVTVDGTRRHADVIIYGTGFRVQDGLGPVQVVGEGGRTLEDAWRNGMEAFLGVSVAGFPNFFTIVGPNTGLGHNSMVYMIESQINYIMSALGYLKRRRARAIDVRADVQASFNRELQKRTRHTVWSTGCRSWYLDRNGKNTALWPGFTFEFRRKTKRIDPRRYRFYGAKAARR